MTTLPKNADPVRGAAPDSWLRALAIRLFGDPATVEIEHRILNGIMALAFLTGILATVINVAIGASGRMIVATAICTFGGLIGHWASARMRNWRRLLVPIYLVFLALLAFAWITQAGTNGTVGYYFFLLVCYPSVLLRGARRIFSILLTAATLAVLLFVELLFPAIIIPYPTPLQRFADVAFALPLCLGTTAMFVVLVYREYQRERNAKDELLRVVTAEKEQVERSMREKQRLLTVVCHDIANALTVLQGEIALVQMSQADTPPIHGANGANGANGSELSSSTLERMGYACGNIDEIISSVRMLEAVEQGSVAFSLEPVDLRAVFKNAEMIFTERLSRRRASIEFPTLAADTGFVMAEPRILANQVFGNLISNAIKFSYPDSRIVVSVARHGTETTVRVIDQGIGMPADLVAKLFDLKAKTSRPGTAGEPGTGFGLRTVKSFVDLFGGQIEIVSRAESEYPADHGTSVSIRLASAPG